MDDEDVQAYIYEHIPIVEKNRFTIADADAPYVTVRGALADHVNHRGSGFGGSISTVLILAAWATVRNILRANGAPNGVIVIQSQEVKFVKPVTADFTANIRTIAPEKIHRFMSMLKKFGKSRLKIDGALTQDGSDETLAAFSGDFVVVLKE
jgi:thioesterase domain-containing protein